MFKIEFDIIPLPLAANIGWYLTGTHIFYCAQWDSSPLMECEAYCSSYLCHLLIADISSECNLVEALATNIVCYLEETSSFFITPWEPFRCYFSSEECKFTTTAITFTSLYTKRLKRLTFLSDL